MTTFRLPVRNQQQGAGGAMEGGGRPPARVSVFRRFLVRVTPAERLLAADVVRDRDKDERQVAGGGDAPAEAVGSVALDRMVLSFMEDQAAERPQRGRCGSCFNGGGGHQDASDDEDFDFLPSSSSSTTAAAAGDALELLKGLVQCANAAERTLLADASRIAERCGGVGGRKKKAEVRRAVAAGLRALGHDAAVCRSRWERGTAHPAGEHEYVDAVVATASSGTTTRLVVEVDFRAEFEVARPTKAYRAALQALPPLFVGSPDRLGRVVAVVAEAARQSLRKRGLHFPPWRKPEYMRAKWLAPHARDDQPRPPPPAPVVVSAAAAAAAGCNRSREVEMRFGDEVARAGAGGAGEDGDAEGTGAVSPTTTLRCPRPALQPEVEVSELPSRTRPTQAGKLVTGLASVL